MKFTQAGDNNPDHAVRIGAALTRYVAASAGDTVDRHTTMVLRMDALVAVVAAVAEHLPPWEQRALAESLGLIYHHG
jgi:hypothetical protein